MTAEREKPSDSETEARGFETADGYVYEVVSKSPNRATVTKRVTTTKGMEGEVRTAPTLSYANPDARRLAHVVAEAEAPLPPPIYTEPTFRATPASRRVGATDNVVYGTATNTVGDVPPTHWKSPSPSSIRTPPSHNPASAVRWVRTMSSVTSPVASPPPQTPTPIRQAKNVRIGGSETKTIEPSRLSPWQVERVYAPIRYISKRELRAKMARQQPPDDDALERHIRCSSVPRLDSFEVSHSGRDFAPYGDRQRRTSPPRRQMESQPQREPSRVDRDEYMYFNQPMLHYTNASSHDHRQTVDPSSYQYQQQQADDVASVHSYRSERSQPQAPSQSWEYGASYLGPSSDRAGSVEDYRTRRTPQRVTTIRDLPNHLDVTNVVHMLAYHRGVSRIPQEPPYCQDAFRLLNRGTYLVKYGRTGAPHERFLALRVVADSESSKVHPYLLWSVHSEAATFKEKLHLTYLVEVTTGVDAPYFQRHLLSPGCIQGPYVGGKKSQLPTDYAFTLRFSSTKASRLVSCLALDEQTFHCWLLVCQYFASVNCAGEREAVDVDTMAPDTPRSSSAGAFA